MLNALSANEAIQAKVWDPSVTVLTTGFPTVVQRMADDLDWTEKLGAAMVAQDQDVLAAVRERLADDLDAPGALAAVDARADAVLPAPGGTDGPLVRDTVDALLGIAL